MNDSPLDDVTVVIPFDRVDGNRDWLAQAIGSFPKGTKYLVLENEDELAEAKNEGLRRAATEYVAFFDADDIAVPGFLESLRALAGSADVVYPTAILFDEDYECLDQAIYAEPFSGSRLLDFNFILSSSLVRRRKALEIGGFDPTLEVWEAQDLWIRMHRAGARFQPCPAAVLLYRQHPGQRSETLVYREALRARILANPILLRAPSVNTYSLPSTVSIRKGRCGYSARKRKNR